MRKSSTALLLTLAAGAGLLAGQVWIAELRNTGASSSTPRKHAHRLLAAESQRPITGPGAPAVPEAPDGVGRRPSLPPFPVSVSDLRSGRSGSELLHTADILYETASAPGTTRVVPDALRKRVAEEYEVALRRALARTEERRQEPWKGDTFQLFSVLASSDCGRIVGRDFALPASASRSLDWYAARRGGRKVSEAARRQALAVLERFEASRREAFRAISRRVVALARRVPDRDRPAAYLIRDGEFVVLRRAEVPESTAFLRRYDCGEARLRAVVEEVLE